MIWDKVYISEFKCAKFLTSNTYICVAFKMHALPGEMWRIDLWRVLSDFLKGALIFLHPCGPATAFMSDCSNRADL